MSNELETFDIQKQDLRDPNEILAQAQKRAKALKDVVDQKKDPVIFNKQRYLEFDDWQTLGNFYGLHVSTIEPEYIKIGEVDGARAKAIVCNTHTGQIVGGATAWCMRDEPNWNTRPKYEMWYVRKSTEKAEAGDCPKEEIIWEKTATGKSYPKKEKKYVGEETVPWFQLGSMAQTRAGAKALRNLLSWVAVLAGYKPTPAEEMTGNEHPPSTDHEPETKSETHTESTTHPQPALSDLISEGELIGIKKWVKDKYPELTTMAERGKLFYGFIEEQFGIKKGEEIKKSWVNHIRFLTGKHLLDKGLLTGILIMNYEGKTLGQLSKEELDMLMNEINSAGKNEPSV